MLATVTDITAYRAAVRPTVAKACSWHAAAESVIASNLLIADAHTKAGLRMFCAWQRVFLRTLTGV